MNLNFNPKLQSKLHHHNNEKDEEFLQYSYLPHDLITQLIITKLPIKSILQLKLISKQWYSTISSPNFGITHFKFNYFNQQFNPTLSNNLFLQCGNDYFIYSHDFGDEFNKGLFKLDIDFVDFPKDKIIVVGSCNGLLCLYCSLGYLIVFNPIINQWIKISCPLSKQCKQINFGFGYVSSIDDYKIVKISALARNPSEIFVHVLSLRTREWKRVHDIKICDYILRGASMSSGLLVNEAIYWIMYKKGGEYTQDILGFDLTLEKFVKVEGLVPGDSYLGWVRFVCCMKGCLSMARFTNRGDVSLSILNGSGVVDYIGIYRDLDLGSCCSAVGFTADGKFFVQLGERELGLVDPNSSPKTYTRLFKFEGDGFIDVKSFVPSLLSPFAVTETRELNRL